MTAVRIDGKSIAERVRNDVRREIAENGLTPGLGVILVGDDPASHLYVGLKEKACAAVGIRMEKFLFPAETPEGIILEQVAALSGREDIDAILVQLPLPEPLDESTVIEAMDPAKDVDGFHPRAVLAPGLVSGIIELIMSTGEQLSRKEAIVVANSETFYVPLGKALEEKGVTAAYVAAGDPELAQRTRQADILIIAAGRPKLIKGNMIKPGAIVIDVGTTRIDDHVVGDVDAPSANETAGHLTPVPGGVGPVTVAMLLRNTVELAKRRKT